MRLLKQLLGLELFDDNRTSTIYLSLNSARFLTKNNLFTLKYYDKILENNLSDKGLNYELLFSGLLNYMIFIEQIGSLFYSQDSIKQIIEKLFPKFFTDDEKVSIVQFRNCFAHRFSLATENKGNNSRKFRLELYSLESEKPIIEAKPKWEGDYSIKTNETDTIINVKSLIKFCENLFNSVISENEKGNLRLVMQENEIMAKFTIVNQQ